MHEYFLRLLATECKKNLWKFINADSNLWALKTKTKLSETLNCFSSMYTNLNSCFGRTF